MKVVYHHSGKWISNSPSITFITYTAIAFAKLGHEIHLIVWNNSTEETERILKEHFSIKDTYDSLNIHRINAKNKREFYKISFHEILNIKPEYVITRVTGFLPYLKRLKKQGMKVYFEMHDLFYDLFKRNDQIKRKKIIKYFIERKYLPELNGIICLQKAQQKIINNNFNIKTIIAPTGLFEKNIEIDPIKRSYWAYIGSFDEHKGILDFLNSIKNISDIPVKLIGAKNEKELKRIKDLASEICPKNELEVLSWLNKQELTKNLNDVKYGIIPLKNTYFNRYLTSPLKLFDYYAHKIPPILSDLDSIKDLVNDGETGFVSNWSEESLRKILKISDEEYLSICNNIEYFNKELSWENRVDKIVEGFKKGDKIEQ